MEHPPSDAEERLERSGDDLEERLERLDDRIDEAEQKLGERRRDAGAPGESLAGDWEGESSGARRAG